MVTFSGLQSHSPIAEKVQKRATKLIPELSNKPYSDSLKNLNLPTLKYRHYRGDMIELFKIKESMTRRVFLISFLFNYHKTVRARSNKYKLAQHHCHYYCK